MKTAEINTLKKELITKLKKEILITFYQTLF